MPSSPEEATGMKLPFSEGRSRHTRLARMAETMRLISSEASLSRWVMVLVLWLKSSSALK